MKKRIHRRLSSFLALMMVLSSIFNMGFPILVKAQEKEILFEDFEYGSKTGYAEDRVNLSSGIWYFKDALIGNQDGDKKVGGKSARIRNGSIEMMFDVNISGNAVVEVKHANFGKDTGGKWKLQSSLDGGNSWIDVDDEITCTDELQKEIFEISHTGSIRFRILNTTGSDKRINIDDFKIISDEPSTSVPLESISINGASEVVVGGTTKLEVVYEPENTTEKGVTWSSSDEDIATVDENGVVTGIAEGTVTITATSIVNSSINATHQIEVKSQDILTIAEARKLMKGQYATVKGIVTFKDVNGNFFIQDGTAAIDIYKRGLSLEIGDEVIAKGKIDDYEGLMEIIPDSMDDVIIISRNNELPEPKIVTFRDIKTGNYECQRIKVEKVYLGQTSGYNTTITDLSGDTLVIYRMPELTDIKVGDLVDIIGFGSIHKGTYQLRVYSADDITKTDLGPDEVAPVIEHQQVTEANINLDLEITAKVTDDREVKEVKLFYRTKGETEYKEKKMSLINGEYVAVILKSELNIEGLEYYIWATDGSNESTSPEDIDNPYFVEVVDDDILPPTITSVEPREGAVLKDTNTRPTIKAVYEDPSGIDLSSVSIILDGVNVTDKAIVEEGSVTYIPDEDLKLGNHTVTVIVIDTKGNKATKTWTFTIGEIEYYFYFGQLHSHTNVSDGTGTPDDAYTWARDMGNADFFAVTDHSNWFDNELDNENITDISQSTSQKWKLLNSTADKYYKPGEYVALAGYEMTWSGATGGWGHINTFNTPWFVSRNNKSMDLQAYYKKIAQWPESINQLNHPGKTFGDFADFGYYSEEVDNVIQLIEVGNGEGPIRGSGYFPSYEYYTRALDKGWHLAPSNNQDNHKGNWLTANEARTVILAEDLTRDRIYDAIRDMRVYATENRNLEIMYKINGQLMGSKISRPDKLNISINVNEPDTDNPDEKITRIELISNGGLVSASKYFDTHYVDWNFELDPIYDYYYVKVIQANGDISVTAPIWVGEVLPVGLSGLDVSSDYFEVGDTIDLIATVYNNSEKILGQAKVEFYVGNISPANKIGEDIVTNIGQGSTGKAIIKWSPEEAGEYNIYAVATIAGVDKTFTASKRVEAVSKGSAVKVMVDYAHSNHYVSGDYANKIESFKEMLKDKKMIMVENHETITDEVLEGIDILVITAPQPRDKDNVKRSKLSDSEIEAIARFTERGGSLILTSRANYNDGTGEYQNSVQGNKLLSAIGSNVIFNSDEVVDYVNNGGQEYRLYFTNYVSSKFNLTKGVGDGDEYSFYSGCSVLIKDGGNDENVDFLVKGHSTTKNINAGNVSTGFIPIEEGNVYVLAAEILPSGAKVIISGSTFFSDFEMSGDNRYSNIQITSNILDWLKPQRQIEVKTIREVRDGMPDNFGQTFAIEGRVTAMSEAYARKYNIPNAFFEVIYVQDETGGITVFGVSQTELPLGAKVRVIGIAGQYDGDYQLQIRDETKDLIVLDDSIEEVEPKEMSTADSMKKENEGWLVKIKGIVTRMDTADNSLYIKDDSGVEARVYVNGYIGGNPDFGYGLGKWDPSIKVGDLVSAIGLASTDPVGPRLRVRNTSEIVKIEEDSPDEYPLTIKVVERIENENNILVRVNIENNADKEMNGVVIIKPIDSNDRPYKVVYQNLKFNRGTNIAEFTLDLENYRKGIKNIQVYVWDSLENMKPLADVKR